VIRSLIFTYIVSAVLLAALSFALYKFRLPESQVDMAVNAVYVLSCLIGGFLSGRVQQSRRFFWGLLTGVLYFAFLLLMSFAQDAGITDSPTRILAVLAMCAFSGMAGGMLS
jgi:putative membrane protein (TIGR04086 family)